MLLAQRLYEKGHITYMRTDSTSLSKESLNKVRGMIGKDLGENYLPEKPNFFKSKASSQEAHEAIRPTEVGLRARQLKGFDEGALRLYDLIWRRFVASQMTPSRQESTKVAVQVGELTLEARGRVVLFDGHTRILPPSGREEAPELPKLEEGDPLSLSSLEPAQHFTSPPPRFSEAGLVKELEQLGIGRPSTYASIISTIQERGYVKLDKRRFFVEKIGEVVTDRLMQSFEDLMDYGFTAQLESRLDSIANGQSNWREILDEFYSDFTKKLAKARLPESKGGMKERIFPKASIKCPKCEREMLVRIAATGMFLSCSGYDLPPKERCTHRMSLAPAHSFESFDSDTQVLLEQKRCPKCASTMMPFFVNRSLRLHVCGNVPNCLEVKSEKGSFGPPPGFVICERCGEDMEPKSGRFGNYFACVNEECGNTRKMMPDGTVAPPKMIPIPMPELKCEKADDHFLLRDGVSGLFLAASKFPKVREARPVKISELIPHGEELEEKYRFLLSAPIKDDQGRDTVVRYARASKELVIGSLDEKTGRSSRWRLYYREGGWRPEA